MVFILAALVCIAAAAIASAALAQGAPGQEEADPFALTPKLIEEANQAHAGESAPLEVDTEAAQELPHTDLDESQALNLLTTVFAEAVESPAGIFDEVPDGKFIGTNAEVISSGSAAELAGEEAGPGSQAGGSGPALIESATPLRVEDEDGSLRPVDLSLEHAEGELQAENPIVPVGIPTELGEGVELGEGGIGISFPAVAQGREPTVVEGDSAFYANVQEDTDLLVAPTPAGIETMTQVRSAEAPRTQVVALSLPAGASLVESEDGGAEAKLEGRQLMEVTPATGVDAAGEPVPTTMTVSGDQLRITIEPDAEASFPILVDPNFRLDEYNWTWGGSGFAWWTPVSSAAGYRAMPNAGKFPALDLNSGFVAGGATPNTGAQWVYLVPRYSSDKATYGQYPTSWIEYVKLASMMYLYGYGSSTYPEIVSGLIDPINGGWVSNWIWNGAWGDISGWSGSFALGGNANAKEFVFGLITLENEAAARIREAVAGTAVLELRDEDTPKLKAVSLASPPSGWVNTGEYALAYEAEDTGLGVNGFTVEVEGQTSTAHNVALACSGTNQSICPRVAKSTEVGRPAVKLNAVEAPTGRDYFQVRTYDPLNGWYEGVTDPVPHVSAGTAVELKVDHTAPAISLSGPLTEQETIGTTQPEYPLNIAVADGEDGAPQSGVASVEVKVDGKKVTMANETPWHPACTTQNCSFSGTWTLKASEYALGAHEVEVVAKDAVGLETKEVQEVELGQEPLQTSFTSPHPTYAAHEIPTMSFKGTREGKPVEGVTYRCSLDGPETPTTPCSSPDPIPANLKPNEWHTLRVAAVDKSGVADPTPATWKFKTGAYPAPPAPASASEKLVYPEVGKKTARYYTLEAEWGANPEGKAAEGVTGVSFEMKLPKAAGATEEPVFEPVPAECVIDGQGKPVSWPLRPRSHPGHSQPVYLTVKGCPAFEEANYPEKEIQFRAVFDGGEKVAGASEPNATEFVYTNNGRRVLTDATESIGPADVDLLTGAFSLSRTDVSIPVPGYEANLEFTRFYESTQSGSLPGYSTVLGGAWQPSVPLESEYEGEAWTRIEQEEIPAKEAVYGYACWNEETGEEVGCVNPKSNCPKTSCEEWLEEPAQPREEWIELFDNEGNGIPFEISGETLISPPYAKELKLKWSEENLVLAYPNATHSVFVRNGTSPTGLRIWTPKYISYQATPSSLRMTYEPEGTQRRLVEETAPSPVNCEENSFKTTGCRTLKFQYEDRAVGSGTVRLLHSIEYFGPSGSGVGATVAQYRYAEYKNGAATSALHYLNGGSLPQGVGFVLAEEWNPRLNIPESMTYEEPYPALLSTLTSSGQKPWEFGYETSKTYGRWMNRLSTVSRAGATSTIAYGVPVSGSGAPYAMSPESIATWGQTDIPVDATAVFPPTHVPSEYPPHEFTGATVHYMDPDGYQVNVALPSPPGVTGASITTTETDIHGDIVRELDPQNRLYALEASNTVTRSHELDSHSVYNAAGTEQLESWGPLHKVRLNSGEVVEARQHSVTRYDEEEPTPQAGTPWALLPTKETVGVVVPGKEGEFEAKTTETKYNWELRKPTKTIVDPTGLNIQTVTEYSAAGQVVATRQPKKPAGGGPGETQTVYYSAGTGGECVNSRYANLPCKVLPAEQATGTGRPKLLVERFTAYDNLDEPEVIKESAGSEGEERITTTTYDNAGRPVSTKITGGGVKVPKTETEYSPTLGVATGQHFACEEAECSPNPSYSSSFGSAGTGNGQFAEPAGDAVDSAGDIWVADSNNNRIEEFNPKGEYLFKVGTKGTGNGQFKRPSAVTIDASGNLWVTDSENDRVQEFNSKGEFIRKFGSLGSANGQFAEPEALAFDSKGNLWVADTNNDRLEEFNSKGEFIKTVGSGLFNDAQGVAVAPGNKVFATSMLTDKILEFNETGEKIGEFGTAGSGEGQFEEPEALTVDSSGNVWVTDPINEFVDGFTQAGKSIGRFGKPGHGAGEFEFGYWDGIASDGKGNIFVVDTKNDRVQKWAIGSDSQATRTTYNSLGQVESYEDSDGNKAETKYDAYGRPVTTTDARGSRTVTYDPLSGLPTKLEVSGIGTFTARYDADGDLVEATLPNGLSRKTSYNAVGEPMSLAYTKTSSCGESCTWFEETLERGADGRIISDGNSLASDRYAYDNAGRLTESLETPTGGTCTTRAYTFDADSNRLSKTTRTGVGAECSKSGGTTQSYEYDGGDRLMGTGITYDNFGRIEKLPGTYAGGSTLETKYFSTNMVATQSQGGVTNSFQLDAAGRQRQREQMGGVAGVEVFHYDSGSDAPSWTALGSTWSRNVTGMGGELAAIQESSGTTTFKLTDIHGDVVASASSSPTATKLLASYRFSEFGEALASGAGRFGWLGGKSRRTELSSGVIQMGARSYIPQLGRFLTPDPVRGGSANPYDYVDQDPVNMFDLSGEIPCPGNSKKKNCLGPPSPQQVRKANRTRVIAAHFTSRAAAQRFVRMLQARPNFTEKLLRHAGEWKAKEIQAVQAKAAKANEIARWAGPPPPPKPAPESSGEDCTDASDAAAGTIFVIAAAPETAGASLVIGAIGLAVGVTGNHVC